MYRELEIAMNELGFSLGEVLAVAREISPHDPPLRTIDRLTARERVELVSVLRSARLMSRSFGLDRAVYSGFILSRVR